MNDVINIIIVNVILMKTVKFYPYEQNTFCNK